MDVRVKLLYRKSRTPYLKSYCFGNSYRNPIVIVEILYASFGSSLPLDWMHKRAIDEHLVCLEMIYNLFLIIGFSKFGEEMKLHFFANKHFNFFNFFHIKFNVFIALYQGYVIKNFIYLLNIFEYNLLMA